MKIVKATYDKQADVAYIRFQKKKAHKTLHLKYPILVDVDKEGKVLGVEILNVSEIPKAR